MGCMGCYMLTKIDADLVHVCAALDVLVLLLVVVFSRYSRRAALCLTPYLGWCLLATALNASIKDMNPRRARKLLSYQMCTPHVIAPLVSVKPNAFAVFLRIANTCMQIHVHACKATNV